MDRSKDRLEHRAPGSSQAPELGRGRPRVEQARAVGATRLHDAEPSPGAA